MAGDNGISLVARASDFRFPEFWFLGAALFASVEWSWIYLELSQAHVANVGIGLTVAAVLSLVALATPKQVRRTSALAFALVLAGGVIVLTAQVTNIIGAHD